ncbi:MAG: GNAT family N-acetyltransferase, partial [Nocardioides sp.]
GLTTAWYGAFADDAAEQAGRPRGAASNEQFDEEDVARRIAEGCVWLWEDERGQVVHVTGHNPPTFGVVRIGPVYTPPEQRGRGFASVAVAAVSRRILAEGHRACLFTDQANPTSNKIYEAIGYRPVVDMANFVVTTPALA